MVLGDSAQGVHIQAVIAGPSGLSGIVTARTPACARPAPARKSLADPKGFVLDGLSRRFRRLATQQGVHTNPAFAGTYSFRPGAEFESLFPGFLDHLPDGGVVMCHPGKVDTELRRLDPLTDLREREYAYFLADDFPRLLAAHGIALA